MYHTILLALDLSPTDRPIIEHIKQLAEIMHSRVVLLHVAMGAAAQYHEEDAAGKEVGEGRKYLEQVREEFEAAKIPATAEMAFGEPAKEIIRWVDEKGCDLVAMGTHGHKLLADLFLGATASRVQHNISVPVLLLRSRG
jgi:nucleotide-binding universal stress UspA family protein